MKEKKEKKKNLVVKIVVGGIVLISMGGLYLVCKSKHKLEGQLLNQLDIIRGLTESLGKANYSLGKLRNFVDSLKK